MEPIHRMVNFEVSTAKRGDAVCGDAQEHRLTTMPSNVTCPKCLERTPGLQLRGMIETVASPGNSQRVEAPDSVKHALARIWDDLQ